MTSKILMMKVPLDRDIHTSLDPYDMKIPLLYSKQLFMIRIKTNNKKGNHVYQKTTETRGRRMAKLQKKRIKKIRKERQR